MQMIPEEVRRTMAEKSDAELRRVVTVESDQYQPEALEVAREELARRNLAITDPSPSPMSDPERFALAKSLYRPARGLTTALVALVAVQLAGILAVLAGYVTQWILISTHHFPDPLAEVADLAIAGGDGLRLVCYLAAIVVFFIWLHRMYRNLPALGSTDGRFTPGGAVGNFFIPFVNLGRGYQVMHHLWLESQAIPDPLPVGIVLRRTAPVVGWWWAFHLASSLLSRLFERGDSLTIDAWLQSSYSSAAFLLTVAVAGLLFLTMVRGIARRQHDQWDDIVRRQPTTPQPDRIL